MRIDLHGCHIHEGWGRFKREVDQAYYLGHRQCVVITGQGAMMIEFPTWANNHPLVRQCNQQRYNPGSFLIKLKKKVDNHLK